jgi:hypothetical protein
LLSPTLPTDEGVGQSSQDAGSDKSDLSPRAAYYLDVGLYADSCLNLWTGNGLVNVGSLGTIRDIVWEEAIASKDLSPISNNGGVR